MLRDDNPLSRLGPDPTVEECLNSLDKSFDLLIEGEGGLFVRFPVSPVCCVFVFFISRRVEFIPSYARLFNRIFVCMHMKLLAVAYRGVI